MKQIPTQSELHDRFDYDPDTGIFRRKTPHPAHPVGSVAGFIDRSSSVAYVKIKIGAVRYYAHRLAWLYVYGVWPDFEIDHRDTNGTNNAIKNLRPATSVSNAQNRKLRKDNKLGVKGVFFHAGKFVAKIKFPGNRYQTILGRFNTIEQAAEAYRKAAQDAFSEFARVA